MVSIGWRRRRRRALLSASIMVMAAVISCSSASAVPESSPSEIAPKGEPEVITKASSPEPSDGPASRPLILASGDVPTVDTSVHNVPLSDIVFDTFGGSPRYLPLD